MCEGLMISVDNYLQEVLAIAHPLAPLDMPLLDAHGATLASDVYAGERLVLRAGRRIRSTHIGIAASIGLDHLPTRPHPRVVVISAGEDLTEPGHRIDEQHSYEANSWLLTTAVREVEAIGYRVHTIPDTTQELTDLIEDQLVRADLVVITSGPRSVEMMRQSLNSLGEIHEREVAMEPQGHHSYGLIGPDRTPVITLPSDSKGAYIAFELFVRPMIRQMLGRKNLSHRVLSATLAEDISSTSGLRSFFEALISHENEVLRATPVALSERGDANGLIVIDDQGAVLRSGSEVSVILFDRRAE
jgi:molybdopterin biosynthesis enzyme